MTGKEPNLIGIFVFALGLAALLAGMNLPWWSAVGGWVAGVTAYVAAASG